MKSISRLLYILSFATFLAACGGSGGGGGGNPPPPPPVSNDAGASDVVLEGVGLDQIFQSAVVNYTATVSVFTSTTTVTANTSNVGATMTVNGTALGAGVSSTKISLDLGSNIITLVVTAEDGVTSNTYTIDVTRQTAAGLAQTAYIKASNTGMNDFFGGGGLMLDGDTLVAGSFGESSNATGINGNQADNSAPNTGALYVFTRDASDVWSKQAYIKASNTEVADQLVSFRAAALDGDTLVAGARAEDSGATGINGDQADNSATDSGAVYVLTRDASDEWSQEAYIKAYNTGASDSFGLSVALDGDTLVVGATGEDSGATGINGDQSDNSADGAGAVYVFTRDAGNVWSQQAYIKASNTEAGDVFGRSVALDGDTLVVTALEDSSATGINGDQSDNSADRAGAVYVFTRDASDVWSQQAYIKASNTEALDFFGSQIALDGDSIVIAAVFEDSDANGVNGDQSDNSADRSGAAYVFTRNASQVWSQQAYIKSSNSDVLDRIEGVALDGDTLAIGAVGEASTATGINGDQSDNSAAQSGAVYVFTRDANGVWIQQAYTKASNTDASDNFGFSIALDGETLVVAGYREASNATGIGGDQSDNSVPQAGAVYVIE